MATGSDTSLNAWNLGDLFHRLGPLPLARVRMNPPPGQATERDLLEIHDREGRLCELIDGALVEKTMGSYESMLAMELGIILGSFVRDHKLGRLLGEAGMLRLAPNLVRIPDLAFIAADRLSDAAKLKDRIWSVAPNLAVEVISLGNTAEEMSEKLRDYFAAGVQEVWYVYPLEREVRRYTSSRDVETLTSPGQLTSNLLPGFVLDLDELFVSPNP